MQAQKTIIHLPVKNTNQVALRVPDYDLGKKWYMEKLDFRLMHEWPLGPLQLGYLGSTQISSEIVLIAGAQHCSIDVESVDRTLQELQRRKVKIMGEPCDIPLIGKRLAFLSDPWGNLIELSERLK